ncbi:MAG: glutamate synthase subunit beta [Clostridiales bacterium]|nr:glutamate synthase subunit beta [Clostridiales bacterium]
MAKPTGFMEHNRKEMPYRDPLERIKDWNEFSLPLSTEERNEQAARCMDCGTPFCQSGIILNGLASGCPLNNLIPEWNDLIYHGLWKDALERLLKTNNFPEFTARVCPAPCEGACTLGVINPQITIKNNELAVIERGFEEGWIKPFKPVRRTGKKVAVVGSGPAGLACADQLNKVGHSVTVYERADRAGGLMMYGIPNMKMEKRVVERRLDLMNEEGILFVTGTSVGIDVSGDQLRDEFDAVVLACGSTVPRDLKVPGRESAGIYFAVDYLSKTTKSMMDSGFKDGAYISAKNKDVVVIGGGDTGNDCVATAIRQGCSSVRQFEIMPEAAAERTSENPWPEFPKVKKTDYGQKECIAVFGNDPRQYCISTKSFSFDEDGNVTGLNTTLIEWSKDSTGRFFPREIEESEEAYKADLILLAMGFVGTESSLIESFGIEIDTRGNVKAEYGEHLTSVDGVYACGDMRRGQSLVVWAIREGREAAREVDTHFTGSSILP